MGTEIIEDLRQKFPEAAVVPVRQELDAENFAAQKAKAEQRNRKGGAIGVVWTGPEEVVLVRRTGLHAGWAITGGSVEEDEEFDSTFVRENKEETGLNVSVIRLVEIEDKVFVSPDGEELHMPVAFFEGSAEGQTPQKTAEAEEEGLEAVTFNIYELPEEMIMKDREKIIRCSESRRGLGQKVPLR